MDQPGLHSQRIDKWLWHARFARTRTAAQKLALSGHVRINRTKVTSASQLVRRENVLTIALTRGVRVVEVVGLSDRRLSASQVVFLFSDQSPPSSEKRSGSGKSGTAAEIAHVKIGPSRRPNKRDRRMLTALKKFK